MFPHPITVVSASLFVTLLIVGFTVLSELRKMEDEETEWQETLKRNTFPCRKCGDMVIPVHLKKNKWGYKCSCKNSWILNI